MTGNAPAPPEWRNHSRNQARREALARRFRDPDDPLRLVPVRDMWLTGFGARRAAWRPDAALVAGLSSCPMRLGVVPRDVVYRREAGTAPPMPPCGRS